MTTSEKKVVATSISDQSKTSLRTKIRCFYNVFATSLCRLGLCKNEYSINETKRLPSMLSSIPPLRDGKENVSYNVESLFTNIPMEETVTYIIEQIYVHGKLTPTCLKLIFRRLLIKLAIECTFKFNRRFLNKWMVALWEDHYLLLLVILIWSKWKMML